MNDNMDEWRRKEGAKWTELDGWTLTDVGRNCDRME